MNSRILILINFLLLFVIGGCIYYIMNSGYTTPRQIYEAQTHVENLSQGETTMGGAETPMAPVSANPDYAALVGKDFMQVLYTPTPTPSPTPSPTPEPPNLFDAVASWNVVSMDTGWAELEETREGEEETFELTVGGPPRLAKDRKDREVEVRLDAVDMDEWKITLAFGQGEDKQTHEVAF